MNVRKREREEHRGRGSPSSKRVSVDIEPKRIEFAVINSDNYSTRGEREYQSTSSINQTGSGRQRALCKN